MRKQNSGGFWNIILFISLRKKLPWSENKKKQLVYHLNLPEWTVQFSYQRKNNGNYSPPGFCGFRQHPVFVRSLCHQWVCRTVDRSDNLHEPSSFCWLLEVNIDLLQEHHMLLLEVFLHIREHHFLLSSTCTAE